MLWCTLVFLSLNTNHFVDTNFRYLKILQKKSLNCVLTYLYLRFNPIICGVEISYLSAGGGPQDPPYVFSEGAPQYQLFLHSRKWVYKYPESKNEPPIIKTLDLRVKNIFPLRVGNNDFRQKSLENTKNFVSSDFKIAVNNYRG